MSLNKNKDLPNRRKKSENKEQRRKKNEDNEHISFVTI